jgi:hypothetical protein
VQRTFDGWISHGADENGDLNCTKMPLKNQINFISNFQTKLHCERRPALSFLHREGGIVPHILAAGT